MSERDVNDSMEKQLEAIDRKIDRLDEAIRGTPGPTGNGSKPGILIRLDRLEQDAKRQSKLIWLIVGALVTGLSSAIVILVAGSGG